MFPLVDDRLSLIINCFQDDSSDQHTSEVSVIKKNKHLLCTLSISHLEGPFRPPHPWQILFLRVVCDTPPLGMSILHHLVLFTVYFIQIWESCIVYPDLREFLWYYTFRLSKSVLCLVHYFLDCRKRRLWGCIQSNV